MAEYIHTICFRASEALKEELLYLAGYNRRKLSDVVRLLVELALEVKRRDG